jgi:hypothetical protein
MTFNNKTFADLGVTPDSTHVWTWGTGLENQNFTLQIGPDCVPDAGSTVSLVSFSLLGRRCCGANCAAKTGLITS